MATRSRGPGWAGAKSEALPKINRELKLAFFFFFPFRSLGRRTGQSSGQACVVREVNKGAAVGSFEEKDVPCSASAFSEGLSEMALPQEEWERNGVPDHPSRVMLAEGSWKEAAMNPELQRSPLKTT